MTERPKAKTLQNQPQYYTLEEVAEILRRGKRWLERQILADEAMKEPLLAGTYTKHVGGLRLWSAEDIEEMRWRLDQGSKSTSEEDGGTVEEQSALETSQSAFEKVLASQPKGQGEKRSNSRVKSRTGKSKSSSTEKRIRQRGPMLQPVT